MFGGNPETASIIHGFGMGASTVAIFSRVGGGIFTKCADVGSDLVGKIEVGNGQTHELEVDLSDLPSGTYSVTVYAINEKEGNEVLILF